jgi:hypothetical protein
MRKQKYRKLPIPDDLDPDGPTELIESDNQISKDDALKQATNVQKDLIAELKSKFKP